ncbi:MFS transporter [Anaeroselena agilis]|uniref:MFS transporter n=1 Tax=Anaeroselena agilis TaxID=3063788 RepID=A0ABU3NSD6_9FIRM|nr:MFS transporter [Selenomonadales bacterium 4137-cl]
MNKTMERPTKQRVMLATVLFLILVIAYFDRVNTSVLAADDAFLKAMGIENNPVAIGSLMSMFLFAYAIANAVLSPLGDIYGPRLMMIVAVVIMGVSMIIGGLAQSLGTLLAARAVLGIGEGLHWPMQMKFVKNWFPPPERGKANSAWLLGLMFAPAVAMPFFTWLISFTGWRLSFFVLASFSLVSLAMLYWFTTDRPEQHKGVNKQELEHVMAGLRAETEREAAMGATTTWESYKLFVTNYRYWLLVVFYMCNAAIFWGTIAWLPSYFRMALGFNWAKMGAWSSLPYVLGLFSLALFGYLTDRYGKKIFFSAVSMLLPAIFIYMSTTATTTTSAAIYISIGIGTVALGLPAVWSIQQRLVPGKALAAGAGLMNGFGMLSSALAPMIIGYFIKVTGSYSGGFLYLVGLALAGCIAIVCLGLVLPAERAEGSAKAGQAG